MERQRGREGGVMEIRGGRIKKKKGNPHNASPKGCTCNQNIGIKKRALCVFWRRDLVGRLVTPNQKKIKIEKGKEERGKKH